jgi:hypothetical protein
VARKRIDGDVVECGVYRGGSALVLADRLLRGDGSRAMWLFDTFGGMPEPGPEDPAEAWKEVGTCTSSEAIVRETFRSAGAPLGRVHFVVGLYAATLPRFVPPPIALLHLDCDWHDSVRLCLETFYDAVVPGGLVVLDDYGHWTGCRTAVDRFLATRSFRGDLIPIDYTSHYFWKR